MVVSIVIFTLFVQMKGAQLPDDFSSSHPNLQQLPARDPEIKNDTGFVYTRGGLQVGQL